MGEMGKVETLRSKVEPVKFISRLPEESRIFTSKCRMNDEVSRTSEGKSRNSLPESGTREIY